MLYNHNMHHIFRLENTQESSNFHHYMYEGIIKQWCCCVTGTLVMAHIQ